MGSLATELMSRPAGRQTGQHGRVRQEEGGDGQIGGKEEEEVYGWVGRKAADKFPELS